MKKRNIILAVIALALLGFGLWGAHRAAFDWHTLALQMRAVSWTPVLLGVLCIYVSHVLRAVRAIDGVYDVYRVTN